MPNPLSMTPRSIRPFSYCFLSFPQTTWPEPRATGEEALWTLRLSIKATFTSFYSHMVSLQSSHRITWNQMNSFIVATVSVRSHQLTWAMWCDFFSFSSFYMSPERTNGTLVLQISTFCISFSLACCTDGNGKRYRLLYFNLSQTTGRMWTLPSTATLSVSFSHRMKPWQMNRWKKCLFGEVPGLYCLTDGVEERKKMWRDDWFLIYD